MAINLKPTDTVIIKKDSNSNYAFQIKNKNGAVMWAKCKPITCNFGTGIDKVVFSATGASDISVTNSGGIANLPAGYSWKPSVFTQLGYHYSGAGYQYDLSNISTLTINRFTALTLNFPATENPIEPSNCTMELSEGHSGSEDYSIRITGRNDTTQDFIGFTIVFKKYNGDGFAATYLGEYYYAPDTISIPKGKGFEFITTRIAMDTFGYTITESSFGYLIVEITPIYKKGASNVNGSTAILEGASVDGEVSESSTTTTAATQFGTETDDSHEIWVIN